MCLCGKKVKISEREKYVFAWTSLIQARGYNAGECCTKTYFCGLGEGLRSRCSCERELGIISTGKRARRTSAGVPLGRAARRPAPSALERGALIRPLARGASDTSKGAQTSSPLAKIEASLRHEGAAVHYSGVAFRSEARLHIASLPRFAPVRARERG